MHASRFIPHHASWSLEYLVDGLPERAEVLHAALLRLERFPVEFAAATVDVDLAELEEAGLGAGVGLLLPEVSADVEEYDDEGGEVGVEEVVRGHRSDGDVELGDEHEDDEDESDPRAVHTKDSLEGELVSGVAVILPGGAEADVGEADGAPGEERREARKGNEPVEDLYTSGSQRDESERRAANDGDGTPQWTTGAVNVRKDFRCVALLSEGSQCPRTTIDTGKTDTDDCHENDRIDEVAECRDAGVDGDNDEGRGRDVDECAGAQKTLVIVRDEETNEGQGQDVEQGDTPEYLLDGTWKRLLGCCRFCGCQTDELSTGEREGSSDECSADTGEPISECAGVGPCAGALQELLAKRFDVDHAAKF